MDEKKINLKEYAEKIDSIFADLNVEDQNELFRLTRELLIKRRMKLINERQGELEANAKYLDHARSTLENVLASGYKPDPIQSNY